VWAVAKFAGPTQETLLPSTLVRELFTVVAKVVTPRISDGTAEPQTMNMLAWAFGEIKLLNKPLMNAIATAAIPVMTKFNGLELAHLAAYAVYSHSNSSRFLSMASSS
jgi:hypothetical protein